MDYRFTAILIVMMTLLALFGGPAQKARAVSISMRIPVK